MGKKIDSNKIHKKQKDGKKKEVRRRKPIVQRTHWKFKNSHKSRKLEKKQKKLMEKKKKTSIQKEEDEIEIIENENELFDDKGYYSAKRNLDDKAFLEWEQEENKQEIVLPNLNELFDKMNEVNEKKLEKKVVEAYKVVAEVLRGYTSGKLPKAFNILPATENWEELINLTEPYNWTPQAMYEATVLFSSGFGPALAEIFYEKYLLPAIRNDIKVHKKLNVHYYKCLKKSLFKPSAFFKGIIFPISKSLTSKEAAIIGSILRKCSIPMAHSSAAIIKLIQLCKEGKDEVSMGALFFLRLILLKKYAMPQQVKENLVQFFDNYKKYKGKKNLPVMWHQLMLIFVQQYKLDLTSQEKSKLKEVNIEIGHELIGQEISKELNYSKSGKSQNSIKMDID